MLGINGKLFDWRLIDIPAIEHQPGVVALLARHGRLDGEILDAVVAKDMNAAAERYATSGCLRRNEPGVVVGILTRCTVDKGVAASIVESLQRSRWVRIAEADGPEAREWF